MKMIRIKIIKAARSQASIEMMAAIGIMIIIFILMSFFAFNISRDRQSAEDISSQESLCMRISNIITGISLSGPGTEFRMKLDKDASFDSGIISVTANSQGSCASKAHFTNGTSSRFSMPRGNIVLKNVDGMVVIEEI